MTVLYVILAVLAVLVLLILLVRIGIIVVYDENGFSAVFLAGPLRFKITPKEEKKKKPVKKRERKAPKKAGEQAQETEKAGAWATFKTYWPYIKKLLESLKKGLKIDELIIHYVAAGEDPVTVALTYGGVSAALGMITSYLEQNFNIRKRDYRSNFNFAASEPCIYFKARITLTIWQSIKFGYPILTLIRKPKDLQTRKEEK